MRPELDVLRDTSDRGQPGDEDLLAWVSAALEAVRGETAPPVSLAIRIIDADESRRLNRDFRGHDKPTNVLSFPAGLPSGLADELPALPVGDLAICAPLVASEAAAQGKPLSHHWAHLVIHGVLHLLGYDHEGAGPAARMEALECAVLDRFSIPDPYTPV